MAQLELRPAYVSRLAQPKLRPMYVQIDDCGAWCAAIVVQPCGRSSAIRPSECLRSYFAGFGASSFGTIVFLIGPWECEKPTWLRSSFVLFGVLNVHTITSPTWIGLGCR